jgi:hypothetical protein
MIVVDGLFSDNPDLAVATRDELSGTRGPRSAHAGPLHEAGLGG